MTKQRFLLASLLPLSIACGGASSIDLSDPNGFTAPTAPSHDVQALSGDAGPALATHCDTATSTTAALCIENAQGHAGEVVDVPIYFIGSTACTDAYEANGHLVADANDFALANPVQQVSCITRDYYGAPAPGTIEIMWNAFGGGSVGGCPNDIVPGKLDTVQIEILPGTPPGDYPITWSDAGVAGTTAQCGVFGPSAGIAGMIRVLP